MLPSIFGENIFDDWTGFGFPEIHSIGKKLYGGKPSAAMKTDIKETDGGYELSIDLPGINRDDVEVSLDDGYLVVSARRDMKNDDKDGNGKIIRQERYMGSMKRSFYVGDSMKEDNIKAKFSNGVLTLSVPKEKEPEPPKKKLIAIDG